MNVSIETFEHSHAALIEILSRSAFVSISEEQRPDQNPDLIAHLLGAKNPAGASRIAIAREGQGGAVLGCLAAIPARFRRRDASVHTGHQIGYYFVDNAAQGRGVGSALLADLTGALKDEAGSFVYTFPNPRSIGRFDRLGYERVRSIPTIVYPRISSMAGRAARSRDASGRNWKFERIGAETAREIAGSVLPASASEVGFVRDAAYFAWRMGGPNADERYRFVVCRAHEADREPSDCFIIVLAAHKMMALPFTILVDLLAANPAEYFDAAVRAAGQMGASPLVYANSNLAQLSRARGTRFPHGLPIPGFANPRPIELLMLRSERGVRKDELAESVYSTADWMGF